MSVIFRFSSDRTKVILQVIFIHVTVKFRVVCTFRSVNTLQPVEEDSIGTDTGNLDFQEQHKNSVNEPSSQNEEEDETTSIQSTPSTKSTINRAFKKRQQRTSDSKLLEELKKRSADRTAFMRKILEDEDEVDIFMHSIAVQVKKLNPQLIAEAKVGILSLVNRLQFRGTLEPTTSPCPYSSSSSNSSQLSYDFPNLSPDSQFAASQVQHTKFVFPSTRSHSDSDSNYINM